MDPVDLLEQAWVKAGYPKEYIPRQQFLKAAPHVLAAYTAGNDDFLRAGWALAKVDFPFAPSHPRYAAMMEAYEELAGSTGTTAQ